MSIESQASAAGISKYYRKNWRWSFNIGRHGGSYPGVREFPTFIIILMTGSKFFQALWKSPCWGKADVSRSLRSGSEGSSLHKVSLNPCIKPGTYYELQHDSQSLYTPWKDVSITTALMMSRQSVHSGIGIWVGSKYWFGVIRLSSTAYRKSSFWMKMDLAHENLSIFPTVIYSSEPPFANIKVKLKSCITHPQIFHWQWDYSQTFWK